MLRQSPQVLRRPVLAILVVFVLGTIEVLAEDGRAIIQWGAARAELLAPRSTGIEFRDAYWWNGDGFDEGVRYAVDQRLTSVAPDIVLQTIDLAGGYAIPPFGEAHTHRPDGWPGTQAHIDHFLEQGIYYVMNHNSFASMTAELDAAVNVPGSIDVLFANGGLTPPGSHVVALYERNLERGVFPEGWSPERLDGEGFFRIESAADLDAKWPSVLAGRPDFVKVFMGFSEEYERRHANPSFVGKRGIDPRLVPAIVERARAARLRVSAHIETAEDFRIAVRSGVNIIAHLPASWRVGSDAGFGDAKIERWLIDDEDARAAAAAEVIVVAHVHNGLDNETIGRIHRHNLGVLKRAGVYLALGSDSYRETALLEAITLHEWGLFSPVELLQLAGEETTRAIYPDRKIGRLDEGYEASFLVLDGNPITEPLFAPGAGSESEDGEGVIDGIGARIRLRVKQGTVLP